MSPEWESTAKFILLPELKLLTHWQSDKFRTQYKCTKQSEFEVCPKCATKSFSVHDRRWIKVYDQPIRGAGIVLHVLKRRFRCPSCKKVFTEPLNGVRKGFKTTERYRRGLRWACENFKDLKRVQRAFGCSAWLTHKVFYEQLELKTRERINDCWGKKIGIDEHTWRKRRSKSGLTEFASLIVDYDRNRIAEVVNGKTVATLKEQLDYIPGRERVQEAVIDMCDPFKKFVKEFFPNANLTADKFHVLRLANPMINKARMEITGDRRSNPVRHLLLRNRHRLKYFERSALDQWLVHHPKLKEIYWFKEALHQLYRTKGFLRAQRAFTNLTDRMARSALPEIKKLRTTLMKWRKEILHYFESGLTNAKTEGYNRRAKGEQYNAFGVRSFFNYRLRLLNV
jgi:transposase